MASRCDKGQGKEFLNFVRNNQDMNKLYNGGQGSKKSTVRVYDDCVEFKDPTFCIGWILRLRVEYALTCFTFATLKPYFLPPV